MMASSPVVAVMAAFLGLRPVAKAFGAGSSTTNTRGTGMPAAIDICSTTARSSANSGPSAGRARTMVSAAWDEASHANARYPRITRATMSEHDRAQVVAGRALLLVGGEPGADRPPDGGARLLGVGAEHAGHQVGHDEQQPEGAGQDHDAGAAVVALARR